MSSSFISAQIRSQPSMQPYTLMAVYGRVQAQVVTFVRSVT